MKKLISTFVLVTFMSLQCFSQKDFRNGYVILNNNDTIFGLINYGSNLENTEKCVFRANMQSPITTYSPETIILYRFEDSKYFISKKINPNDSKKIFLEFLFDGIVNLYDYFDQSGVHFLISQTEDDFVELKNEIRTTYRNDIPFESSTNDYIGVLKNIFRDSPAALNEADKLSLTLNPLIDIVETYHKEVCPSEECIIYAKKKVRIKLSLGLIAGVSSSNISINQTRRIIDRFFLPTNNSQGFKLGTSLDISDPFFSRRLCIQSDLTITNTKYLTNSSSLRIMTLDIPVQLKYSIPIKKFQTSVLAGFIYKNILIFDYFSNDYGQYNFITGRNQIGLTGGFEISHYISSKQRIFLQCKYEKISGTEHQGQWGDIYYRGGESNTNAFDTKVNMINILLGFQF